MKNLTKAVLIIVLIAIVSSLIYLQIEIENLNPKPSGTAHTSTPTLTPTLTPKLTSTPQPQTVVDISYIESSRQNIGNNTQVTLTINATYINGSDINLSYSQFYLQLYTLRTILQDLDGKTYTINNGTFNLGTTQNAYIFQLTFTFPTSGFNGMDNATTEYYLGFNGTATVQWVPWYQ